jgi:hypothetical protein
VGKLKEDAVLSPQPLEGGTIAAAAREEGGATVEENLLFTIG